MPSPRARPFPVVAVLASTSLLSAACSGGVAKTTGSGDASSHDAGHMTVDAGSDAGGDASDGGVDSGLTLLTEPAQGMTPVYDFIMSAKKSVDMTMYELTDTTVTGLLTTAATNGITVRVILDQKLEMSENTTAYNALAAGGVQVHWASTSYAATHQKTITIDGTTSAVMTLNLTPEYYSTTRDFAVITTVPADVAAIETVFNNDFTNTPILPPEGDGLVWSPTNAQPAMLALIGGAKASLLIENEEMSDGDVISALTTAASHGVNVEVVMTNSRSWTTDFMTLMTGGVHVVTYASSASIYIHAKVIVADYGTSSASVFVGSENFSNASLTENRELGIITTDPAILSSIQTTLASDFKGGTPF